MVFNSVTHGATSGIGYHLAELFARGRYRLILVARSRSNLERFALEFKEKYGIRI